MKRIFCDGCGLEIPRDTPELLTLAARRTYPSGATVVTNQAQPDLHNWDCALLWVQAQKTKEDQARAAVRP